jgi:hypothetical protein
MTAGFRSAELTGDSNFYPKDHHWTNGGHSLAAHILHEFFVNEIGVRNGVLRSREEDTSALTVPVEVSSPVSSKTMKRI